MTPAECALEPAVAALGEPYRVQHPFWRLGCFADFALLDRRVIIEVDGQSHNGLQAKIKDRLRDLALLRKGWRTVRISNAEAMSDPAGALSRALMSHEETIPEVEAELASLQDEALHNAAKPKTLRPQKARKSSVPTPKP